MRARAAGQITGTRKASDPRREIRRIAKELELDHDDYIEARMKYREYIAVLKQDAPPPEAGGAPSR